MANVLTNGRQTIRKINKRFRHLVSSSGLRGKTDNNKKKKEAEKRTDEKKATKLDQRNFNNEYEKSNSLFRSHAAVSEGD